MAQWLAEDPTSTHYCLPLWQRTPPPHLMPLRDLMPEMALPWMWCRTHSGVCTNTQTHLRQMKIKFLRRETVLWLPKVLWVPLAGIEFPKCFVSFLLDVLSQEPIPNGCEHGCCCEFVHRCASYSAMTKGSCKNWTQRPESLLWLSLALLRNILAG